MASKPPPDVHFERCPRCGAVIIFKKDSDTTVCQKCRAKVKLKS